ncbi:tyrosine-type recombinase/integrase [Myxococcota bacterium]
MGSVYRRRKKLWIRYKAADGKWTQDATKFEVGQEREARKLLKKVEARIAAGEALGIKKGPVTVGEYAGRWLEERKALGIDDSQNDESRFRLHIRPAIGSMPIEDVRPRHIRDLILDLRAAKQLAPKTIRNVYSVLKALFRDAQLCDLVDTSPCILTKYQLGENVDKNPEWRSTAIYTREELEQLISDERVPWDRRVLYALEGIGGLRHGEAAGLRWKHYDASAKPLGRLLIATSYDKGRTKTQQPRAMPVHSVLAAMLAEWRLGGWVEVMGHHPEADDLVVPLPEGPRTPLGKMRTRHDSFKRLREDLKVLGFRHRRGHDLRRTMISLARIDGARKDLLELCTHTPRKRDKAIDVYTEFPWESLCAEIAKLDIKRLHLDNVVTLTATGTSPGAQTVQLPEISSALATRLATRSANRPILKGKFGGGAGNRT